MTGTILLPPLAAVLDAYAREMAETGGAFGLRDEGGLESALGRAEAKIAYADPPPGVHEIASAIAFGIAKNHPFVDGNKRMAFITAFVTLRINGWYLDASEQNATDTVLGLAEGRIGESAFASWLKEHSYRI
ncbi:MAG: type II toxin-antitoxin system death-on-curing family toxin [Alphaproteobacteria bacterium]|nr:type II toxin-antitoxin system death-on-curing family toxin [Alphaproteobacteria bacterium]